MANEETKMKQDAEARAAFGECPNPECTNTRAKNQEVCSTCLLTRRKTIVQRVIDWNEARFDKEFNYPLELSMLAEEIAELYEAKTTVDKLDAIGDIVFVAIGTMWKLGLDPVGINSVFYQPNIDLSDEDTMDVPNLIGWSNQCKAWAMDTMDENIEAGYSGFDLAISSVMLVAIPAARGLGYQKCFYDIVEAICNSNDTKVVKKTASDTKANIDKGQTFVPPTDRLVNIVNTLEIGGYTNPPKKKVVN